MRVLVCGGRDFLNWELVRATLDQFHREHVITEIIHGGAQGADALAARWAIYNQISDREFIADWRRHGRAAGPIRNKRMIVEGRPQQIIAFPGGPGTANMVEQANASDIPVLTVRNNNETI